MSQIYTPEKALCHNSFCQQPLKSETEIRQGICSSCQPPNFKPERDRIEEQNIKKNPPKRFSVSFSPKVRNSPLSDNNASIPRNSCYNCLNFLPAFLLSEDKPIYEDLCVNCLAKKQPELFPAHIINDILPLIFLEV